LERTVIKVPGSTSNLGASFDTCGLAVSLFLTTTIEEEAPRFELTLTGEGADVLPNDESNLIARVARSLAQQRGKKISGAGLTVHNQIPLARGLGSSSAAIITGITVYEALSQDRFNEDEIFRHALQFEDHADNLAPALLGGLVVACLVGDPGGERTVIGVKRRWPDEVRIVLAIPEFGMETAKMRAVLPVTVSRNDAVFNIQRAALLQAAIAERRFDLLSEAVRDRLHQQYRVPLARGLEEVLRLNDEVDRYVGLLGVAVSGAGSTLVAFALENCEEIAAVMRARLSQAGVKSRTLEVAADNLGRVCRGL
jgi:homoserine kinase